MYLSDDATEVELTELAAEQRAIREDSEIRKQQLEAVRRREFLRVLRQARITESRFPS